MQLCRCEDQSTFGEFVHQVPCHGVACHGAAAPEYLAVSQSSSASLAEYGLPAFPPVLGVPRPKVTRSEGEGEGAGFEVFRHLWSAVAPQASS